ncbi:hypothetical protein RND71_002448 [Anisodus tanguticus]|uniref:CRAL-TRIO domain-containing protein n=1 Tax=Anisodus tanguticus TaxID=243964 RepID=A0AAE1T3R7_9SOLA|nr:hypothetical protein RND71_002448 [Anisodus tanguticus]
MDTNQEIALTQLRKSVEKLGSSTESYGEKTLMRFLIARSMDPEKAAKMFVQWKKWRAEICPLGYIPDSEVSDELAAEKVYLQGLTKKGHPDKDSIDTFASCAEFVVHLLDKTIASVCSEKVLEREGKGRTSKYSSSLQYLIDKYSDMVHNNAFPVGDCSFKGREIGNEKLIGILDLQNITYSNVDARGLITGFQFLQFLSTAYYPERLAACYLLNMPQFFVTVWRFVCRFLEKATQEKIRIVTNEEQKEEVIREVGEDVLPEEYGGRAKLVLLQDVAVNY